MDCHAVIPQGLWYYLHQAYVINSDVQCFVSDQFVTDALNTGSFPVSVEQTWSTANKFKMIEWLDPGYGRLMANHALFFRWEYL